MHDHYPSELKISRSKLRGIFDRKEVCYFQIRSLTLQQAVGNALAFAVQLQHFSHLHLTITPNGIIRYQNDILRR